MHKITKRNIAVLMSMMFAGPVVADDYGTMNQSTQASRAPSFLAPQFRAWLEHALRSDFGLVGEAEASAPNPTSAGDARQKADGVPSKGGNQSLAKASNAIARGVAGWYQHAAITASGERYDPDYYTAAHRTEPFGTRLKVVNDATGKAVIVRVNDRISRKALGRKHLVVELSRRSAQEIGLEGVGKVTVFRSD